MFSTGLAVLWDETKHYLRVAWYARALAFSEDASSQ